ncbi:endothelin-converting enzyme 1, partial [Elysia marginata]
ASKYGSVGFILGHEIGHLFDRNPQTGRPIDADGVERHWMTQTDLNTLDSKLECFRTQYNAIVHPVHSVTFDSRNSRVENMADATGVNATFRWVENKKKQLAKMTGIFKYDRDIQV